MYHKETNHNNLQLNFLYFLFLLFNCYH